MGRTTSELSKKGSNFDDGEKNDVSFVSVSLLAYQSAPPCTLIYTNYDLDDLCPSLVPGGVGRRGLSCVRVPLSPLSALIRSWRPIEVSNKRKSSMS